MIKGKTVNLIPLNEEIYELTLKWINQPELRDNTNTRFPVNEFEHRLWFEKKASEKYLKSYGIYDNTSKKVIGIIGLNEYNFFDRTASPYLYIGDSSNRGKGIGTETLELFTTFLKNEMNIRRFYVYLFAYNKKSQAMFENCGYIIEGKMIGHWYRNGIYHDVLIMGKTLE